jgi:YihY family inner membrane protein
MSILKPFEGGADQPEKTSTTEVAAAAKVAETAAKIADAKHAEAQAAAKEPVPIEHVKPVVRQDGWWPQVKALAHYMSQTEVHTYAFSVAAQVILALFPFIVLMLTLAQQVFHSQAMVEVLKQLMETLLPVSQQWIMAKMSYVARPHKGTQIFSVVMLLVTTTGVFLPLEVALNEVWGVKTNRNYLMNQIVSLGLAVAVGILVLASVGFSAAQRKLMSYIFLGHTDNLVFNFIAGGVLRVCAVVASCLLFFLIYWILPNRKIPASAVLPTAIYVGVLWEIAKYLYVLALPKLDFGSVYGPFQTTVGLMTWAFISGLLLLGGAHFSANRYSLRMARESVLPDGPTARGAVTS